jgi:hypothetical protein
MVDEVKAKTTRAKTTRAKTKRRRRERLTPAQRRERFEFWRKVGEHRLRQKFIRRAALQFIGVTLGDPNRSVTQKFIAQAVAQAEYLAATLAVRGHFADLEDED